LHLTAEIAMSNAADHTKLTILPLVAVVFAVLGVSFILFARSFHDEQGEYRAFLEANGIKLGTIENVDDWGRRKTKIIGVYLYPESFGKVNSEGQVPIRGTRIINVIQKCSDLYNCDLGPSDLDSQAILDFNSLHQLESLRLANTQVDDDLCRALAASKHLSLLDVRDTRVTDDGLALLSSSPTLDKLIVGGNGITGEFLHAFAGNQTLRWVVLFGPHADPNCLDNIHRTGIQRIALSCKPSDLPIASIVESKLETIKIGWDKTLDAEDKKAIEAIENTRPRIGVVISSPDIL